MKPSGARDSRSPVPGASRTGGLCFLPPESSTSDSDSHAFPTARTTMAASSEPLPPSVSSLLSSRASTLSHYPKHRPSLWRRSLAPPAATETTLFSRLTSFVRPSAPPEDSAQACFYRLYVFFVLDDVTRFRNELEYFWNRADWPLASLLDPGQEGEGGEVRKAVLAGLTRIMQRAFNRLLEMGLPRDAPAIIDDFEALRLQPKELQKLPGWVEEDARRVSEGEGGKGWEVADKEGKVPQQGEEDGDFLLHGVRAFTPHWTFV